LPILGLASRRAGALTAAGGLVLTMVGGAISPTPTTEATGALTNATATPQPTGTDPANAVQTPIPSATPTRSTVVVPARPTTAPRPPAGGTALAAVARLGGASEVDIDHLVALSDAWQKGAATWPAGKRLALANDPLNLLAVDASTNRSKSDGDTATWLPPNKAFRCTYVARQVAVKGKYGLWVTSAERDAMIRILTTCPTLGLPGSGSAPTIAALPGAANPPAAQPAPAPAPAQQRSDGTVQRRHLLVRRPSPGRLLWPRRRQGVLQVGPGGAV